MAMSAGKLWGMRRLADDRGVFKMVAVDQRPPIMNPIKQALGLDEAPYDLVAKFKLMLVEELQAEATAVLLDPIWALPRGFTVASPAKGLIVTLESHAFRDAPEGRYSAEIEGWSVEKIKRAGGDAVKVLAYYRPDANATVRTAQQDFVKRCGEACARYDIPFLFELLVYPLAGDAPATQDYVEMSGKHADMVLDSVRHFAPADFGVDIFKLESPVEARAIKSGDAGTQALFNEMGKLAGRPWVMLSAGAGMNEFRTVLDYAYKAGASGYLAGRAIWAEPFKAVPDWEAIRQGLRTVSLPYMRDINALTDAAATPWHAHARHAGYAGVTPDDAAFRAAYNGF
ncbi:MAG: tagatose 1,6-diphosphate aldolase [Beijerinckiaceae bacterium]